MDYSSPCRKTLAPYLSIPYLRWECGSVGKLLAQHARSIKIKPQHWTNQAGQHRTSTQGWRQEDHLKLHSESEASLGYMKPCLKKSLYMLSRQRDELKRFLPTSVSTLDLEMSLIEPCVANHANIYSQFLKFFSFFIFQLKTFFIEYHLVIFFPCHQLLPDPPYLLTHPNLCSFSLYGSSKKIKK